MNYQEAIKRLEQTKDGLHEATSLFPPAWLPVYKRAMSVDDEAFRLAIEAMRICDGIGATDHPFDYNDVRSTVRWMQGRLRDGLPWEKEPEQHECDTALSFALVALERQQSVVDLITRWNHRARDHASETTSSDVAAREQQAALVSHTKELSDAWNCMLETNKP